MMLDVTSMLTEDAKLFRRTSTKAARPGEFTSAKPGAATLTPKCSLQDASGSEIDRASKRNVVITHVLYTETGLDIKQNDMVQVGPSFEGRITGRMNAPGRPYGKFGVIEEQTGEVGN